MNRDFVLFNLREAAEELGRTVREIEANPEYSSGELLVAMQHAYHHLNSAWNGQELAELKAMKPQAVRRVGARLSKTAIKEV